MTFPLNHGRMGMHSTKYGPRLEWRTLDLGRVGALHVYEERPQMWRAKVSLAAIYEVHGVFATAAEAEAAAIQLGRVALRTALELLNEGQQEAGYDSARTQEDTHGR